MASLGRRGARAAAEGCLVTLALILANLLALAYLVATRARRP
jgi:hypothetical protein